MWNILKNAYYHFRAARRKPHISTVNKQKRLTFVNEYVNKSPKF